MQKIWQQYGKYLLIGGALIIALLLYSLRAPQEEPALLELTPTPLDTASAELAPTLPESTLPEPVSTTVLVDVKGAVKHPGVYPLTTEERIIDAITMAGGVTEKADTKTMNYAQKLQDEMIIYIPEQGEEVPVTIAPTTPTTSAQTATTSATTTNTVNINLADEAALMTIPGIGPAKAKSIIQYRTDQGQFTKIEDIKNISGIGDKTFEKLKDFISVN